MVIQWLYMVTVVSHGYRLHMQHRFGYMFTLVKVAGYQLIIFMTLANSYTVLAMGICAGGVSVHS